MATRTRATAAPPTPLPSSAPAAPLVPTTSALYDAVEGLRDSATSIYGGLEGNGNLLDLRDELGYLRDRADAVQSAVMGIIDASNTHL